MFYRIVKKLVVALILIVCFLDSLTCKFIWIKESALRDEIMNACAQQQQQQQQQQQPLPEEHQDSLWKRLEVVVAVDLLSVHHGYFTEDLKNTIGQHVPQPLDSKPTG